MTDDEQEAVFLGAGVSDEYKLKDLGFEPDVIYDIGADVGSITTFAHELYPDAKIVAVEPNPWSFPRLQTNFEEVPNVIPLNVAVGDRSRQMYEPAECESPLLWRVVGDGSPTFSPDMALSGIKAVPLQDLYAQYGGERYVIKLDCEGAEYDIVNDPFQRRIIHDSHYFAAEFHFWGATQAKMNEVVTVLQRFLFDLAQTHTIYTYSYGACSHVWAKRRFNNVVEPRWW